MSITFTTPVGRIVQGELWKGREQKNEKTGAIELDSLGQPKKNYFFAIAIAKQPGHTHWAQTDWGAQIYAEGHRAHPNFAPHPAFSWKIEDGDSAIPNKKGKKNCDRDGHRGHWILKFSSNFAIDKTYDAKGEKQMSPEAFKTGYYVQVCASCKGNTGDSPGVYLNPLMVALSGCGTEISGGPDVSEAGFGAAPLPVGAGAAPLASTLPTPGAFAPPAAPSLPPPVALPVVPSLPTAPVAVAPNPAFLAGPPPMPMAPPAMPVPPAPVVTYQMTAAANGFTRDQYVQQGWTDAALRAAGMMV